jgi:DNA polymerase/3'-5' exonuclease PolX
MEMAKIYFQNKEARKGGVFSKAAKALRECETPITTAKEALALKGIGKGIANYIQEVLDSGSIKKLEELRAGIA